MPQGQGESAPQACYPTPGLRQLGVLPKGPVRAIKQVTTGGIYAVGGDTVYHLNASDWSSTAIGTITSHRPYPVSMQDNGNTLVIVDGTVNGWTVDLGSNAFAAINDPAFYGADRVDYLDTYLLFNKPNTPQFYSSDSLATTFDSLYFANKESFSDLLITIAVAKREIWLFGERTTEIWYNSAAEVSGTVLFPFQEIQSVFVDHGCRAKYSVATYDDAVYWLSYDRAGQGIVLSGAGYLSKRISTYAIEAEIAKYARTDDAIGMVYSLAGHVFYVLTFPTADHTWVYDITSPTGQWHEWAWIDDDGEEHRHRANCMYAINGIVVAGDWENGNLYAVENTALTDNGQPIKRQRSFPHILNEMDRVYYRQFIADIESGNEGSVYGRNVGTFLNTTFTAPNNTLLSAYHNSGDTNATWTLVSGTEAAIEGDELTGPIGGGVSLYQSLPAPGPDYSVQFQAVPTSYTSVGAVSTFAIARSTGTGTGYRATVAGDGTQYQLTLGVEGGGSTTIAMGTLAMGGYAITMSLRGTRITLAAQRTTDFAWLQPGGSWSSTSAPAIVLDDGTWSAGGRIMLGGTWPASSTAATGAALVATTGVMAGTTPASVTTPAINTTGANALFVYTNVFGITTLTDSAGNLWNHSPPSQYNDGTGILGTTGTIWYASQPIHTSAAHTFTAGGYYLSMLVSAWSGMQPSLIYDTESAGAQTTGTTLATGPVTPGHSNSFILAVTGDGWTGTPTVDSGFTMLAPSFPCQRSGADPSVSAAGWAWLGQATAAPVDPTFTFGPVIGHAAQARAAVFKATPAPPPSASLAIDNVVAIDQTPTRIAGTQIFLEWSDDRGHSYGSPVGQAIGATGRYLTSVQWQRIGYGRDRVFRLTWSVPVATALQGAFIEVAKANS